jgi:CubicO group peptidase (beta-lactamase class C family)
MKLGQNNGGFSPEALKRIDQTMNTMVQRGETPGMVGLVYRRGQVAHVTTAGWQDIASKTPMSRDTIFQIMSMTKPVTAAAALALVDDGLIDLYDPVEKFLPELAHRRVLRTPSSSTDDTVPVERPIHIADLLTYRAGLVGTPPPGPGIGATALEMAVGDVYNTYTNDSAGWLKALAKLPLGTQPGTAWHYGTASEVLVILISRVSGMPYEQFLQKRICDPLGM